jgi:hypothetical protein
MQKHKFSVTYPGALLYKPHWALPRMKTVCQRIMIRTHQNALCDPQIPMDAKTQVRHHVSRYSFFQESIPGTLEHKK